METKQSAAAEGAAATAKKSQSIIKKKMSPQEQQYLKAISMPSAELGAAIRTPTARIFQHVGNALAHDVEAKKERAEAQREFLDNIGYYYEAKQRLLNPGYRTDVDGGKDRTAEENEKNYGAPDWATFATKCAAYSLQHADRKLKAFAKANGLLTDEGKNIDDPEPKEGEGAGRPQPRRTEDPTAQKRYAFIASAAMEIASRNPDGEVEKQILAAAEYEPAPLMPVSPDLFTEVLSFITRMSSSAADAGDRVEAKQLLNKMRLHKPAPEVAKIPAEVAKEEKRKRDKRLAKKNGQPLGSAACNPPANGTSEHVQRLDPTPPVASGASGNGALPARDPKASPQAELEEPASGPGAEPPIPEAAGGGQPGAAGSDGDGPAPFCPGDWVTFDSTCKFLGRLEGQKGRRFLVTRYDKKPKQWRPEPTRTDWIQRRLTLEEVREKFPGAAEAWLLARPQNATPKPAPCSSSKMVYEAFRDGPKVLQLTVPSEPGDAPRVKFYVCAGEQTHPYLSLDEAKAACDMIAGKTPGGTRKRPAPAKATECPAVRGPEEEHEHETVGAADVQRAGLVAEGRRDTPPEQALTARRLRKAEDQRDYYQRKKQAGAQSATPAAPQEAGPQGTADQGAAQPAAAPTTDVPAGEAPTVSRVESRPVPGMGEAGQNRNAQPGEQQLPPVIPITTSTRLFRVKTRSKPGFKTDYLIICNGDKVPYEVFDTESEAKTFCDSLNAPRVAGIVPLEVDAQPTAESAA